MTSQFIIHRDLSCWFVNCFTNPRNSKSEGSKSEENYIRVLRLYISGSYVLCMSQLSSLIFVWDLNAAQPDKYSSITTLSEKCPRERRHPTLIFTQSFTRLKRSKRMCHLLAPKRLNQLKTSMLLHTHGSEIILMSQRLCSYTLIAKMMMKSGIIGLIKKQKF